jgi:predicted  nucleic acid-binding Zn-ribbon protein
MYLASMDPSFLAPLIPIAAIVAFAAVKIAKLRATSATSLPADAADRLEALEQKVDGLQQEVAETHERLDFAERLLSQARDTRRLGE